MLISAKFISWCNKVNRYNDKVMWGIENCNDVVGMFLMRRCVL